MVNKLFAVFLFFADLPFISYLSKLGIESVNAGDVLYGGILIGLTFAQMIVLFALIILLASKKQSS